MSVPPIILPLKYARYCANCDNVHNGVDRCPACGDANASVPLTQWLNRTTEKREYEEQRSTD